jgi:vacuolar protein sorting-associated protein 13A/C
MYDLISHWLGSESTSASPLIDLLVLLYLITLIYTTYLIQRQLRNVGHVPGAASRMWSVYSGATRQATALVEESSKDDSTKRQLSSNMAAHAARSLITTLPYAIENHSGISASYSIYDNPMRFPLPTSSTQFFRFELFPGRGSGGQRVYGQDLRHLKSITLYVGDTAISIQDMDHEVTRPRSAHFIPDIQAHVFVNVVKHGNSTVRGR